jgi:hypothetical protein
MREWIDEALHPQGTATYKNSYYYQKHHNDPEELERLELERDRALAQVLLTGSSKPLFKRWGHDNWLGYAECRVTATRFGLDTAKSMFTMSSLVTNRSQFAVFKELCMSQAPWREGLMVSMEKLMKAGFTEEQFWDIALLGAPVFGEDDELLYHLPGGYDDSSSSDDALIMGDSHSQHEKEPQDETKTPTLTKIVD